MYNQKNRISVAEATQNFSRAAQMADENGSAVISQNQVPRYVLISVPPIETEQFASDEELMAVSQRLIEQNRVAYELLEDELDSETAERAYQEWVADGKKTYSHKEVWQNFD